MSEQRARLIVRVVLSLGLIGAGLFTVITVSPSSDPELFGAATGWIGLVMGYWLR